jgi:hypothetical protein
VFVTLLHDANGQLRRLRATGFQLARAFREWYLRIYHGNGANVIELDDAALPRTGWCFLPSDHLVAGDVMLAQKIALETDERGALALANKFFTHR